MKKKTEAEAEEKPIGVVSLLGCRCRCGHEWLPHGNNQPGGFERPSVCPKCKTPRWDKPKKWERAAAVGK
jgi:hypothetical protein